MVIEVWKTVDGFGNYYEVSNTGKVRSVDRLVHHCGESRNHHRIHRGCILKQKVDCYGYATVHLRNKTLGKELWPSVHRLVAEAFIPNPENKLTVNHKDGNKLNNSIDNLEWADSKEQMNHASSLGLLPRRGKSLYSEEFKIAVKNYHTDNQCSIKHLARAFSISPRTANRIVLGQYGDSRKLTSDKIEIARSMRQEGKTLKEIAEHIGSSISVVHRATK